MAELSFGDWLSGSQGKACAGGDYEFGVTTPFDTTQQMIDAFPMTMDKVWRDTYKRYGYAASNYYAQYICDRLELEQPWQGRMANCGMAAISTFVLALQLKPGDHVIVGTPLYGETEALFQYLKVMGVEVTEVDPSRACDVRDAYRNNTRLVFLESVGNGLEMPQVDLKALFGFLWTRDVVLALDNTLYTTRLFNPWSMLKEVEESLGARAFSFVYLESMSKWYRCGDEDPVTAGLMICEDKLLLEEFDKLRSILGGYLQMEALAQLPVNPIAAASKIMLTTRPAQEIYQWLRGRKQLRTLSYPGMGSIIFLELDTNDRAVTERFCDALSRNLGGGRIMGSFGHPVTTLIPFGMFREHRAGEVRISVGWDEPAEGVIEALKRTFSA